MGHLNACRLHSGNDRRSLYGDLFVALIPAVITGVWLFGLRTLAVLVVCVAAVPATETIYALLRRRKSTALDLTGLLSGLLLGLTLPSTLPLWEAALGAVVGTLAARFVADSCGRRLVNPTVMGHLFLSVVFFGDMTAAATPLAFAGLEASAELSPLRLILGLYGGAIGTTCLPALLLGAAYLWLRRSASPLPTLLALAFALPTAWLTRGDIAPLLMGNFVFFSAFLLAEPSVRPRSRVGVWTAAVFVGLVGTLFAWVLPTVGWDCGFLLMGAALPLIDSYCRPVPFGRTRAKKMKKTEKNRN